MICGKIQYVFVEGDIFRDCLISVDDISINSMIMTEDMRYKIHEDSNSQDEFCQKMGVIFWERNGGHNPMSLVSANSQLKSEPGKVTSPTLFHKHRYSGYCPRLPPKSNQCYGIQQRSLVWIYSTADKQEMAHPAAIESTSSSNAK